jgi:hypothetical protein
VIGLIKIKLSPMYKQIKSLLKSRVQMQAKFLNSMSQLAKTLTWESPCLISTQMLQSQQDLQSKKHQNHKPQKHNKKKLNSQKLNNNQKLKHLKKLNQNLKVHNQQSVNLQVSKENRLDSRCQD